MLLSVLLLRHNFTWVCGLIFYVCCCHVYLSAVGLVVYTKKTDSREVHMTTTQIEDTATYPIKIVTKQQGGQQNCTRNIP